MHIEELSGTKRLGIDDEEDNKEMKMEKKVKDGGELFVCASSGGGVALIDVKRLVVGAGARALFYPTLLYNVVRNKVQAEFRWWDWIDEFVLLGAVPFPSDVPRLKDLGVTGVVTLNEPYETLVSTSLYQANGIHHLVLPTRDYLFAPVLGDICQAVDFIHENASNGQGTYVHCKAGRGRSTTIVICYLIKYKQMMPDIAYGYVKSIRPRVLLASAQWKAVNEFYQIVVKKTCLSNHLSSSLISRSPRTFGPRDLLGFDDGSVVVISKADLDGYDPVGDSGTAGNDMWDLNLIYRVRVAGGSALARLSYLWLHCRTREKMQTKNLSSENNCSISSQQLGGLTVDIHVYSDV